MDDLVASYREKMLSFLSVQEYRKILVFPHGQN